MFAILFFIVFLANGVHSSNYLLSISCKVDVNLEFAGDYNTAPSVTCDKRCSEMAKGWFQQRMYYREPRISALGMMVQMTFNQDETVTCELTDEASDTAIAQAESVILERDECSPVYVPPEIVNTRCSQGYVYDEDLEKCYRISNYPLQWPDAECSCAGKNGILAIIDTPEKQQKFQSMTDETVWIGLSDMEQEGVYAWKDNSAYSYNNFDANQPADVDGTMDCVEMNPALDFMWRRSSCSKQNKFICEEIELLPNPTTTTTTTTVKPTTTTIEIITVPGQTTTTTTTPKPKIEMCPSGWSIDSSTNKCFHLGSTAMTFSDSASYCKLVGGFLASITSDTDFVKATEIIGATGSAYIGLSNLGETNKFAWKDGSRYDYKMWAKDEPSGWRWGSWGLIEYEECTEMNYLKKHRWNDVNCDSVKRKPLCTMASETFPRETCPPEWKQLGEKCFSVRHTSVTYATAVETCALLVRGSVLTTPTSESENAFLTDLVTESTYMSVNDLSHEGKFVYLDNKAIAYNKWDIYEPNNRFNQDCSIMLPTGGFWNDKQCSNKYFFMCATPASMDSA